MNVEAPFCPLALERMRAFPLSLGSSSRPARYWARPAGRKRRRRQPRPALLGRRCPSPTSRRRPPRPSAIGSCVAREPVTATRRSRPAKPRKAFKCKGQTGPIAQIGIGRLAAGEPLRITVILPPNIILPSNVHVATDEKDDPGIELAWRRCLPGGCIAEAKLDSETIKSWRTRGEPGKLSYKDATGRVLAISFSFRGLAPSLDALAKETR
jgi:hypothetical protein